jgi:hypothetical protein
MQLETFGRTPRHLRGFAGRPGSPLSDVLKSVVSSGQDSECSVYLARGARRYHAVGSSAPSIDGTVQNAFSRTHSGSISVANAVRDGKCLESEQSVNVIAESGQCSQCPTTAVTNTPPPHCTSASAHGHTLLSKPDRGSFSLPVSHVSQEKPCVSPQFSQSTDISKPGPRPSPQRRLSDPEVRLIFDLDRKLEWLSCEVEPGRKPFHFLMLPNHWLNTSTWVVFDPVSRVSGNIRRIYGDPRFNYPLPDPKSEPRRPKYPVPQRKKAELPRLDSWRLAVNRYRKSSGVRELLNAIELFDDSADEPPDGAIDPASWILPKPPQGFEMSSKQKNAYYEGQGGWQEKLNDWQNVRRAYRARNIIFEGKANRRRVIEVARSVGRTCERTTSKLTHVWSQYKRDRGKLKRERRHGRLGGGSIPRRSRQRICRKLKVGRYVAPDLQCQGVLPSALPIIEEPDRERTAAMAQLPVEDTDGSQVNMTFTIAPRTV